jgi:membrane protease YdiL (CAAX protease family)
MAAYLSIYVLYFSGRIFPHTISGFRHERFRSFVFSTDWPKWILAAFLFVVAIESAFVVNFRLIDFPEQSWILYNKYFLTMPGWMAWLGVAISSLVAGICEECGFRGYLQYPIEKRYGAKIGIAVSSVIFTLVHLHQAWAGAVLPIILLAGILLSILAFKAQSLIYPIIAHSAMDVFNFSYWWSNLAGKFEKETIFRTGFDLHFTVWLMLLIFSTCCFLFICFRKRS